MRSLIFIAAIVCTVFAGELSDCKCGSAYHPVKNSNGIVVCHGNLIKSIMPCNVPERPRCVCSGGVTGIVSDRTGIHCSIYKQGIEQKRWECENQEEWEKFFETNPSEKI